MKIRRGLLAVALGGALITAACSSVSSQSDAAVTSSSRPTNVAADSSSATVNPATFRQDMRKLWEDHVQWTRLFIVSAVAGLPDSDATLGRLLQNQADIGNAVASYYGKDAGVQFSPPGSSPSSPTGSPRSQPAGARSPGARSR
ncbi:MAG: hypothetical protein QOD82_7564 [Pseudonocardiales bacterium]|nr:hypothetical protein [Pseudonocardiales bacterium]